MGNPVALVRMPLVGVPSKGVTSVGDVAKTNAPVPVSPVTAVAKFAELGVARKVATPVPRPLTPVLIGRPVAFVSVPLVGVPSIGVTSVGDVAKTSDPLPVSFVTAAAKLAELGVPKNVATPVPSELNPVPPEVAASGVVALSVVNAPDDGVVAPIVVPLIVPPVTVMLEIVFRSSALFISARVIFFVSFAETSTIKNKSPAAVSTPAIAVNSEIFLSVMASPQCFLENE
jgi:hypothetical protein